MSTGLLEGFPLMACGNVDARAPRCDQTRSSLISHTHVNRLSIELECTIKVSGRSVEVAFLCLGTASQAVGNGKFGLELESLAVVSKGALQIALSLLGKASHAVGNGKLRIELDRPIAVNGGAVEVALPCLGSARML
jgi:hypothetical protein